MKSYILRVLVILTVFSGFADDLPELRSHVNDYGNLIGAETELELEELLSTHEAATTNQVVILTVETIGDMSIEEYAVKIIEKWKIGQKGKDNGLLFVVSVNERDVRIETGYGMEHIITDLKAGRILQNYAVPAFRNGDYNSGIRDAVTAVIDEINGYDSANGSDESLYETSKAEAESENVPLFVVLFAALIMIVFGYFMFAAGTVYRYITSFIYGGIVMLWLGFTSMILLIPAGFAGILLSSLIYRSFKLKPADPVKAYIGTYRNIFTSQGEQNNGKL